MKLLVFAHTPPPHHGQSYMVELLLDGLAAPDSEIQCFHVNARLSDSMEDIGGFRVGKIFRLLAYCAQAIWLRIRHGVDNFYYIPAPAKPNAIYRDWIVLVLCRPFFKRTIFHWHAFGLGEWTATATPIVSAIARKLHGNVDLSIVLTAFSRSDAARLHPKELLVVPNGIPDPFPDFADQVLPERHARWHARQSRSPSSTFQALFLAHCTSEKGLFDTVEAIALQFGNLRLRLVVAGNFLNPQEEESFQQRKLEINQPFPADQPIITYRGFISGDEKKRLLAESDCLCFPSFYPAEALPVTIIEALASGLPVITTRWHGLAELLPDPQRWSVDSHSPTQIAEALLQASAWSSFQESRQHYLQNYTVQSYLGGLQAALQLSSRVSSL